MILINVHCQVEPTRRQAFIAFLDDLVAKSRMDAGNLFYNYFVAGDDPNAFLIVENWADDAAVAAHNQTAHLQNFIDHANDYLTTPFEIKLAKNEQ